MNLQKKRRKRGVILTNQGFQKLQAAKSEAESDENNDKRYTLEDLSLRTSLDPDTLMKVFACTTGVDKRTLTICFRAFNLRLESTDYQRPESDLNQEDTRGEIQNPIPPYPSLSRARAKIQKQFDWGEAPDVSEFYGRTEELATLHHWIINERCRLVTLLGMGGMGKTSLSVKLTEQIQDTFEFVIWRSLHNAPPIKDFLAELIRFLSNEQEADLPETIQARVSLLIHYLRASRCLLVFDNVETILQGCDPQEAVCNHCAGLYCQGYQGYGELFRRVGEVQHQSCLVLTSREKPKQTGLLEGDRLPVRILQVKGLQLVDIQEIFRAKGCFQGSIAEWCRLIDCYAGNPLALKVVATTILKLFDGSISDFLNQNTAVFGDILNLLEQQFNRLSVTEKDIINWLVFNRQPASFSELRTKMSSSVSPQKLLEALESLEARSLIDKKAGCFSVQPVVMEYTTYQFVEEKITEVQDKGFASEEYQFLTATR
jgi:DNA-binding HxlR family transcriptional regulator